jgi:hypothetical protein
VRLGGFFARGLHMREEHSIRMILVSRLAG